MMQYLKAKDVLSNKYKTISVEDTLGQAIEQVNDDTDTLFVFKTNEYLGFLTEKEILQSKSIYDVMKLIKDLELIENLKLKNLKFRAPKINENTSLLECCQLMIENDINMLPVFENGQIMGVVNRDSVLKKLGCELFGDKKVKSIMSKNLVSCSPHDTLFDIIVLFRTHNISSIPVILNRNIEGVISIDVIVKKAMSMNEHPDIFSFVDKKKPIYMLPVEEVMNRTFEVAKEEEQIKDVISIMLEVDANIIIVLDQVGTPIGMLTKTDLLEGIIGLQQQNTVINVHISSRMLIEDRDQIALKIQKFLTHNKNRVGKGNLFLYFNRIKQRKSFIIQYRAKLNTDIMKTHINGEGRNEEEAIEQCLARLKKQIDKTKSKIRKRHARSCCEVETK